MTSTAIYDYKNQAWTENGKYVRCGHPVSMNCQCYGRLHQGESINHQQDSDCDVDVYGSCVLCGVLHGDPCVECGGRGFHASMCPISDANYYPQDEQAAVIMLQHAIDYCQDRPDAVFVLAMAIPDVFEDACERGIIIDPLAGASR